MSTKVDNIIDSLSFEFLEEHPKDAARCVEQMDGSDVAQLISSQSIPRALKLMQFMSQASIESMLSHLTPAKAINILNAMDTAPCAALLMRLEEKERNQYLENFPKNIASQLREYMSFPEDSAGRLMDKVSHTYYDYMTVGEAIKQIKSHKLTPSIYIYLVDSNAMLSGRVNLQQLLTADDSLLLSSLSAKVPASVGFLTPKSEVSEIFEKLKVDALPVVDAHGHMVGILYASKLIETLKENVLNDIQTMVGASADERALSSSFFSVKKRLPWLYINLITAFVAASVVGLFEGIISKYTALAVLLPVVAGQSGNAGAQALAVTMRGLSLREITVRHWFRVAIKEFSGGLISGVSIAVVCAIAVYFWSKSVGLSLVLFLSMLLSVAIACISGALVPIVLKKFGQDPAQSSSIILTTVTDVAGFFSFLGIASLLAKFL